MKEVTAPSNANPTPMQVLHSSKEMLHRHRELMQQPAFVQAVQMAEAQYVRMLATSRSVCDGNTAAANFYKISGASEFINVLKNLGETAPLPPQSTDRKLDHKV